jgi:hypothetical protein
MSDYLGRAVERETSAAPAVRPLLPSFFEPGPPSAIMTALETESPTRGDPFPNKPDETERKISALPEPLAAVDALWPDLAIAAPEQPRQSQEEAGKSPAGLAATPIAPSTTAAFSIGSSPARQQQLPGAAATEPAGRPTAETPPKLHKAATEEIVRPTDGVPPKPLQAATEEIVRPADGAPRKPFQTAAKEILKPTGDPPPGPVHAAVAQQVVRPVSESPSGEVGAVPTMGERRAISLTAPPVSSARASSEPKSVTPPAPAPPTQVVAPAHATIPRISPAPSRIERAGNTDNASSPRPVHITIGRIEVRAIHPPPEPVRHRPAPAAPKISLEEYLKQRNRGGR